MNIFSDEWQAAFGLSYATDLSNVKGKNLTQVLLTLNSDYNCQALGNSLVLLGGKV